MSDEAETDMTPDGFILDNISESAFEERNFYFWVRCVIDALDLIGPETDSHLEEMSSLLLDYYGAADVSPDAIERIPREIQRLRGITYWRDNSPLGLKYRCINNLAYSREKNLEDIYYWQYGLVSSFDLINLDNDKEKEQALNALIRENASKYGVDLYETNGQAGQDLQNVAVLLTQAEAILNLAALILAHAEDE